jgi:GT2 family glycosyltransferase
VGAGPLPYQFTYERASDVFPTNNALVRREVLNRSGLFDLAYDRMSRADGDLGMRVYLSGAFMVYNPAISVLHHHAPRGGLRTHKARVITYASSRSRLLHRHLPSVSELYLEMRYFSIRQQREAQWTRVFGTFAAHGSVYRKLLKIVIGLALLPNTLLRIRQAYRRAVLMLDKFPQISKLDT